MLPVVRFDPRDDALAHVNASRSANGSSIFTESGAVARRYRHDCDAGMIGVNTGLISHDVAPFGAVKQSGIGREGSNYGIEEYLDVKDVCIGGLTRAVNT